MNTQDDDTDSDGLSDLAEISWGTNPKLSDSDGDLISDLDEYDDSIDYPNDSDTDNDGWSDGIEEGVNTLVPSGISPAGVLYTGTSRILYNISPSFPDGFTPDPRQYNDVSWDFIENGRLDEPEEQYLNHQQDPDVPYWLGWSDCNNDRIMEAFGSGFNTYGIYTSCSWYNGYPGAEFYQPAVNHCENDLYYDHVHSADTVTFWYSRYDEDAGDYYDNEEIQVPLSNLGLNVINIADHLPPEASLPEHIPPANIYSFDINYILPEEDQVPRKHGDAPVSIPYQIVGIREGALKSMTVTLTGDVGDPTNPNEWVPGFREKHRVYYVTSPSGQITWDGILYSGGSTLNQNKENPEYLKTGRNVSIRFDVAIENSLALEYFGWYQWPPEEVSMLSNRMKRVEGYSIKDPSLYFWKPWNNNIFLAGETVNFQLAWDDAGYTVDTINWETDSGDSGQGSSFQLTFPNPGIYNIRAIMRYDSNKDGTIDSSDKIAKATYKVNVIQIEHFTVTDNNPDGGESLIDSTDDHATPDEILYIVQDKTDKAQILMNLSVVPQNIDCDDFGKKLLWRIRNKSGGDAYNWNRNKGNFMDGIPVAEWTDTGDPSVNREFEVYAGFDKNNNNMLDITQDSNNEAFRKINILIMKIDLQIFKTGTMSSPGDLISQDDEKNALKLGLLLNDDNDDNRPGNIDNDDQTIGSQDNDIVKLSLNILPSNKGSAQLSVKNPSNIQVFKTSGIALLSDYSVNLESPSGDLAALSGGSMNVFIEGMSNLADEKISLIYKDTQGVERGRDEVHFAVVSWSLSFEGPDTILRGETGRFEVKTNIYGADIPGVDYLNWQFVEASEQKTVTRPVGENSSVWEGILVAPGTVTVFVDFPDRGFSQDFMKTYTITSRTGSDWEMPEVDVFSMSYRGYYGDENEEKWTHYPYDSNLNEDFGSCTPMLRPDYVYDGEDKSWNDFGEGSGPNKGIYYVEKSYIYISCRVLLNRYLMGSSDPPANQTPPGIYPDYNNTTRLFSKSVELHETWGTDDNPPSGLVANSSGHFKLYKPQADSVNLRSLIEPKLGFGEELEFKSSTIDIITNKMQELYQYGNPNHVNWVDPFPTNTWIDLWREPIGWYQQLSTMNY